MFGHVLESASKDCEWCASDEHDSKAIYVNLVKNQESYTAFEGVNIWKAIYQENCLIERIKDIDTSKNCTEETLLYQLISGLHASINIHVATHFYNANLNLSSPNYDFFAKTIGKFPDRIRNLYFLYSVVLRAINRAESTIRAYDYNTLIDPD